MFLSQVIKNAEPGDIIVRFYIDANDNKTIEYEFVLAKNGELKCVTGANESIYGLDLCDDKWEIKDGNI